MNRHFFGLSLALVCACACLSGCELLDHEKRANSGDLVQEHDHGDEAETDGVGSVKSPPPKGFFKGNRLPGALSSDAREIERSLGVP